MFANDSRLNVSRGTSWVPKFRFNNNKLHLLSSSSHNHGSVENELSGRWSGLFFQGAIFHWTMNHGRKGIPTTCIYRNDFFNFTSSTPKTNLHIDKVTGLPKQFPYEGLVRPITVLTCAAKAQVTLVQILLQLDTWVRTPAALWYC